MQTIKINERAIIRRKSTITYSQADFMDAIDVSAFGASGRNVDKNSHRHVEFIDEESDSDLDDSVLSKA